MKKIIISIICSISILTSTNAFFGSPTSLDLYKNIDSGIEELEDKIIEFELNGGQQQEGLTIELNKYAVLNNLPACLDESKNISVKDFKNILDNQDISLLSTFLLYNCSKQGVKNLETNKIYNEFISEVEEMQGIYDRNKTKMDEKYREEYLDNINEDLGKKREKAFDEIGDIDTSKGSNAWNSYSTILLRKYFDLLDSYNRDKEILTELKSQKIYKISNIGLYSDGILENSGFDLITDLEDIDQIIFASENEYEGEEVEKVDKLVNGLANFINEDIFNNKDDFPDNTTESYNSNKNYKPQVTKQNGIESSIKLSQTQYVCSEENYTNGLTDESIRYLLNIIEEESLGKVNNDSDIPKIISDGNDNDSPADSIAGDYSKVSDNSEWPCEKFFCIKIDFIMYQHNLFGGGENMSIEYLLNRSNKHLKKFAATSLVPAKMSTNQFELGLKDLNLPDIFHIGFQISTKPIPILRVDKQEKEDESQFAAKNLIKEYYKAHGLDYKRRNDIELLLKIPADKQNTNSAASITNETSKDKINKYDAYIKNQKRDIELINNTIYKKTSYGIMGTFEEQFSEVNKFTVSINKYVNNMYSIIDGMNSKPIDKN